MTLEPLLAAPAIIQVHAFAAMAALALGMMQLAMPKGTLPHKTIGLVWIVLMTIITVSSALIQHPVEAGDPFWKRLSPIHAFTILTAFGLISGVLILLRGGPGMRAHSRPFISIFIGGLVVAGALAFLPGRIMHRVVFGG